MPKIKQLTVNKFRGIVEETLDLDKCSLLLLGENGTGKSSFVDAIEFYFTGGVGHLEEAQAISTPRHAPHINFKRDDVSVSILFDKEEFPVTRTFKNISEIPANLTDFQEAGAKAKYILRRKNLLDFILAQPGDRYSQLAAIIGVADLDKAEKALMQVQSDLEIQVNSKISLVDSEKAKLTEIFGPIDFTDKNILSALNKNLLALKQKPLKSLREIENRKISAVSSSRSPIDTDRASKDQNLINQLSTLLILINSLRKNSPLWSQIERLKKDKKRIREILFQDVLTSSKRLLSEILDLDLCPVCLQPIDREELLESIDKRINSAEAIEKRTSSIKKMRDDFLVDLQRQTSLITQVTTLCTDLGQSINQTIIDPYVNFVKGLMDNLNSSPVDLQLPSVDVLTKSPEIISIKKYIRKHIDALQKEMKKLEPTEQDRITVQVIDMFSKVQEVREKLSVLQPELNAKTSALNEMNVIYDCFVSTKKEKIREIYNDLEGDIKRFFKVLHVDEGYREIKLDVKEDRRASTEIKMDFHDRQQEDPRAFNSEGHLDSLGFCIFLAFVKRFNFSFPIIILDDVVSSIDSGHRQRICKLLFEEFPNSQFLITTHDYIWFDELCSHQRAFKRESDFKNIQILGWSLDEGPRLDIYKSRIDRIIEKINGGDKGGAANDLRKESEGFLLEVAISIQTRLPIKRDGKYTVGDLFDPVISQFKKLTLDGYNSNETVIKTLQTDGIFGNLLSHNNPYAENASIEEIKDFYNALNNFEGAFRCSTCNKMIVYYPDAKIIKCHCKKTGILWHTR